MRISVVGGGRWARTIAAVLTSLPSRADDVVLHSPRNAPAIAAWIQEIGLPDPTRAARLRACSSWPLFDKVEDRPDAIVVANRVDDHFAAASAALGHGIPVLVEKPVTISHDRIVELHDLATRHGVVMAASHVFLFARYFQKFAKIVVANGTPQHSVVTWTDGAAETRRGEAKSYDAAVTLADDVLPHIVPLLEAMRITDPKLESFQVGRGGAELSLSLASSGGPVSLLLARDSAARRREISIQAAAGRAGLNFASEPGQIRAPRFAGTGDPDWNHGPTPLAAMLNAFLACVEGAPLDPRLSLQRAMPAAGLADDLRGPYLAHQAAWLAERVGRPFDDAVRYACKELSGDGTPIDEAAWSRIDNVAALREHLSNRRQSHGAPHAK